ncbi:MAG: NADH-quinone oxidoreductase subunit J [Burkholderiaceae bacterium]|nr:NADH-quinone oxidoreductase subunit J [Pseudomonadota bacterium]MCO5116076.1 NADH-quinone oxidoreductase subunit J [Burkholderiaceae bacterium]MCP5219316.1 NADH-quinone oxidoreductase subunit J [Burkholderiaceae bacterium]
MDVKTAFFYLFSLVMLFSAFRVITARNPVHAVLFLMLAFSQAAGVWLLLQAEFLAIVLVLVYLGAVMVLFLFVVMMLDIHIDSIRQGFWRHFPLALVIGAVITLEMAAVLFGGFRVSEARPMPDTVAQVAGQVAQVSNTKELGVLMFTQYLYPVEIAAVILLIAMIAAIALTLRERRKDNKAIDASLAVRVRPRDRVQLVKLASTQAPVPAPAAPAAPAEEVKK